LIIIAFLALALALRRWIFLTCTAYLGRSWRGERWRAMVELWGCGINDVYDSCFDLLADLCIGWLLVGVVCCCCLLFFWLCWVECGLSAEWLLGGAVDY